MSRRMLGLAMILAVGMASAADFSLWQKKMQITFSGYNPPGGATTLTNFPALVVLSTNISGFSYAHFLSSTNADLRFTDATQTNELSYEIDSWNTNGSSYVWVQLPRLTNSASIWAYWGMNGTNTPTYTTNGATWTGSYIGVWHLGRTNAPGVFPDSTSYGRSAANSSGVAAATNATGMIGSGQWFTNVNNTQISVASSSAFDLTSNFTICGWYNSAPPGVSYRTLTAKESGSGNRNWWGATGGSTWMQAGRSRSSIRRAGGTAGVLDP